MDHEERDSGGRPADSRSPFQNRWFAFILGGLLLWGIILAVGSTGAFIQEAELFDVRKSVIVLVFSAAFVGFWLWLVLAVRGNKTTETNRLSLSSVGSVAASLFGFLNWGLAYVTPGMISKTLGWIAGLLICASLIPAIVGLSDPLPRRGKLLGLLTLALFIAAFVLLVAFPPNLRK
ncbi:MAG: hypothetical protein KDA87_16530 [Planctomycetales bacterium]|nr:hypothetical protein [Planctomycetales bacterium]